MPDFDPRDLLIGVLLIAIVLAAWHIGWRSTRPPGILPPDPEPQPHAWPEAESMPAPFPTATSPSTSDPQATTMRIPDGLTPREGEVAWLAAQGRSTREIADALGLSPNTVQNHLRKVYEKLGVRSRGELTGRFVVRAAGDESSSSSMPSPGKM